MKAGQDSSTTPDPIFAAISACDAAWAARAAAYATAGFSDDEADRQADLCDAAEMLVAQTEPASLAGLHAACAWLVSFIQKYDGMETLYDDPVFEVLPYTLERATLNLAAR